MSAYTVAIDTDYETAIVRVRCDEHEAIGRAVARHFGAAAAVYGDAVDAGGGYPGRARFAVVPGWSAASEREALAALTDEAVTR